MPRIRTLNATMIFHLSDMWKVDQHILSLDGDATYNSFEHFTGID